MGWKKSVRKGAPIDRIAKPNRVTDLSGKKFGKWTVEEYYGRKVFPNKRSYAQYWSCRCECGDLHAVEQASLVKGRSTACVQCGIGEENGSLSNELYGTWLTMKDRCSNPKHPDYEYYGKRGIEVCHRWRLSFKAFVEDVGERPEGMTLDRENTNGNYEPNNVRWADHSTQMSNRRPFKLRKLRIKPWPKRVTR
jgi:hypothetical protein